MPEQDGGSDAAASVGGPAPAGRVGDAAALVVLTLGSMMVAGWVVRIDVFALLPLNREPMKATTAICLVLLGGASLLLRQPPVVARRRWALGLATASGCLAALGPVTRCEPLLERALGLGNHGDLEVSPTARMSPATALAVVGLRSRPTRSRWSTTSSPAAAAPGSTRELG